MIILLDVNKQIIHLYNQDGISEIPFSQVAEIIDYVGQESIYYVTKAIEANAEDIINLIKSMGIKVDSGSMLLSGNKYIHAVSEGTVYIADGLKFEGKFDCQLFDEEMKQIIEKTPILQELINRKKIEIIREVKKNHLLKAFKNSQKKQVELKKKSDEKLEGIILQTRVDDYEGIPDDSDAIVIELGQDASPVGGFNTMTELLDQIEEE